MRASRSHLRYELPVYLLVALIAVGASLKPGHVPGDGVDMYGTLWFFWWIQDCILALRDPGFTDLFFHPLGKDIFAHTGNNFVDAVLAAPFHWAFGNPGYYRWFVLTTLVANALSFRVLVRGLLASPWAVFGATLAWELNPYVIFELTCGRITQAFLVFLPLALHHLLRCEDATSWRHPVLAGVFTGLQAWTYWFMGWFMALAFAWIALVGLWRSPTRRALLLRYAGAGLSCLVVVSPAALQMLALASDGVVPGLAGDEVPKDLFSPPGNLRNNVSSTLHGWWLAETQGPPMLTSWSWAPVLLAWLFFGRDRLRWGPAFLLVLLFAIGPGVQLGERLWVMPHYMAAYHYLPFFDRLWFPYRMLSVLMLLACVGLGQLFERLSSRRFLPALIGLFALATCLEQSRLSVFPLVTRDVSMPQTFELVRDEGGGVIHLPFGINQPAIVWQTYHGQPLFGGMGENAPLLWPEGYKGRLRNSFVKTLIEACRNPSTDRDYARNQRKRLQEEGFRWVVLHRDLVELDITHWSYGARLDREGAQEAAIQVTRRLVEVLGEPVSAEGTYVMWDLLGRAPTPAGLEPTDEVLYTVSWRQHSETAYETALKASGRMEAPTGRKQ